jgi:NADH dehydrogenase
MILVTGAAGFAGSRIVARLTQDGEPCRALVRDLARDKVRLPERGVEVVQGNTTRPETLPPALHGVDTIIHAAFITADRKQSPGINYRQTNVVGTQNLLDAARTAGVRRIVELGGLGTKAARHGSYMETRYAANQHIRQSGLAWSILGPSIQFGPGSAFFKGLADLIRQAPVVPMVGSGKRQFQPIWVEDVVTCLLKMARDPQKYDGQYIEVGGPAIYTYAQILDLLMNGIGKRKLKVPGPLPAVRIGAAIMSATLANPPITPAAVDFFTFDNMTALDAVPSHFGFAPRSLEDYISEHGVD